MTRFIAMITGALLFAAGMVGLAAPAQAAPAHRLVYVANLRGNSVSAYDPATGAVVATIPVGAFPESDAVSPDGRDVYVVNDGSNTVSVIDTATNTVTATIPVGRLPGPVAFSPDGTHAYVANFVGSSVSVIDTATNTVTATTTDANARTPSGVAITPDGTRAYTANFNSNTPDFVAGNGINSSMVSTAALVWLAVMTDRKARAHMARTVQRCQEPQRRVPR